MKTLRKQSMLIAAVIALFSISSLTVLASNSSMPTEGEKTSKEATEQKKGIIYTKMSVTNNTADTVDVYVVFAASDTANKCCPSPATPADFSFLNSIPHNDLMATFKLEPKATQYFDPKEKCFSGNFGFYIEPQCEVKGADFKNGKNGTSIGEFTLNPGDCDEAFDISLVNGINSYLKIEVDSGLGWEYGPKKKAITSIHNKAMNSNSGNPGVYPVNCTDCIRLVGDKPCPGLAKAKEQPARICNIQRIERGGVVRLSLESPPK